MKMTNTMDEKSFLELVKKNGSNILNIPEEHVTHEMCLEAIKHSEKKTHGTQTC